LGGGTLDLLEVHSKLLDHPQKRNGSALSQSGRMGPSNYRGQRTAVYTTTACTRRERAEDVVNKYSRLSDMSNWEMQRRDFN